MSNCCENAGLLDKSLTYCDSIEIFYNQHDLEGGILAANSCRSIKLLEFGLFKQAKTTFYETLLFAKERDDTNGVLSGANNVAICYNSLGMHDSALACINQYTSYTDTQYFETLARLHYTQAEACFGLGLLDSAIAESNRGYAIRKAHELRYGVSESISQLVQLHAIKQEEPQIVEYTSGKSALDSALSIATKAKSSGLISKALQAQIVYHEWKNEPETALKFQKQLQEHKDTLVLSKGKIDAVAELKTRLLPNDWS